MQLPSVTKVIGAWPIRLVDTCQGLLVSAQGISLSAKNVQSLTALVVDDSMLIRHCVCRFLEEHGFSVESATNGQEALEALQRVMPDLIVTDMQMPKMGG